jgi:hypothetical protein
VQLLQLFDPSIRHLYTDSSPSRVVLLFVRDMYQNRFKDESKKKELQKKKLYLILSVTSINPYNGRFFSVLPKRLFNKKA